MIVRLRTAKSENGWSVILFLRLMGLHCLSHLLCLLSLEFPLDSVCLFRLLLLLCLFLEGLHLQPHFLLDLLDDFIVVELLSFLELGLPDTERMIVLVDSILAFSFPDFYLLDDSDQVIAQLLENALEFEFLELDDDKVELARFPDVLLHLGRQHLEVGEDVVAHNRGQRHRRQQDDEAPAEHNPLEDITLVRKKGLDV
jgi:hypothetical protein